MVVLLARRSRSRPRIWLADLAIRFGSARFHLRKLIDADIAVPPVSGWSAAAHALLFRGTRRASGSTSTPTRRPSCTSRSARSARATNSNVVWTLAPSTNAPTTRSTTWCRCARSNSATRDRAEAEAIVEEALATPAAVWTIREAPDAEPTTRSACSSFRTPADGPAAPCDGRTHERANRTSCAANPRVPAAVESPERFRSSVTGSPSPRSSCYVQSEHAGPGTAVGALLLAQALPHLLGPVAGTFADRVDQRTAHDRVRPVGRAAVFGVAAWSRCPDRWPGSSSSWRPPRRSTPCSVRRAQRRARVGRSR